MTIVDKDASYEIMGACFEVYREIGCGFLEAVYQECLAIEFKLQGLPCKPQPQLKLEYKSQPLQRTYSPDFTCLDRIILEIKAVSTLTDGHRSQVHNYLRASRKKLGLLVNFGHHPLLEWERIVR